MHKNKKRQRRRVGQFVGLWMVSKEYADSWVVEACGLEALDLGVLLDKRGLEICSTC